MKLSSVTAQLFKADKLTYKSQTMQNKIKYIDTTRARYDEYIRYCDKEFENFINELTNHILM